MGIGLMFDGAAMLLGKGKAAVVKKVGDRKKSVDEQTLAKGLEELRENETRFRASKNKPLAEPQQGAHLSEDDPFIVWENNKRIREEWGAEDGSAGNVTTAVQRARAAKEAGITEDVADEVLRKLYSNNKYQAIINEVKKNRLTLVEAFGDSIAAHQRITLGRNAADMKPEEYLEELLRNMDAYSMTDIDGNLVDSVETLTSKNVVVADLVVGT